MADYTANPDWVDCRALRAAEEAARTGMRTAEGDTARRLWAGLYRTVAPNRAAQSEASRIDATRYPMPVLEPEGGFTIENKEINLVIPLSSLPIYVKA